MNTIKTCCFLGYRSQNFKFNEQNENCLWIRELISQEIERTILKDYTHFIYNISSDIDIWIAETVIKLKKKHSHITFESAISYKHMVNKSDLIIVIYQGDMGTTKQTIKYAKYKNKKITTISILE